MESIVSNPARWNSAIEDARLQIQQLKELQRKQKINDPKANSKSVVGNGKGWKGKGRVMGVPVMEIVKDDGTRIRRIGNNVTRP